MTVADVGLCPTFECEGKDRCHKVPPLRPIIFGQLTAGKVFYLSSTGLLPDIFKTWHGYGQRAERDPVTEEFTGRILTTVVYTCHLGFKDERPIDLVVYIAA